MAASFKDKPILKILLALVGVALGALAAKVGIDAFNNRPGAIEAQFDTAVQGDPSIGPMFVALREHFPADYEALRTEMVAQRRAGASIEAVSATGYARMAALRRTHLKDLAQAPSGELQAYRRQQEALTDQLAKESQSMCARYSFSALSPTDKPSPAALKLLGDLGVVQFRAIAAGQKNPAKRNITTPVQADGEALVARMKAEGLSDRAIAAFVGQGPAVSETERCQTGVVLSKALNKLPVDQADRLTAFMVANS